MLGWTVLNQLQVDPSTRHIPVQIFTVDEERQSGLAHGAFSYLVKSPTTEGIETASSRSRNSPLRAPNGCLSSRTMRSSARRSSNCSTTRTSSYGRRHRRRGLEASRRAFDCVVLDLRLPDINGFDLLEKIQAEPALHDLPVVVYTGKDLSTDERYAPQDHGQEHRSQRRPVARAVAR